MVLILLHVSAMLMSGKENSGFNVLSGVLVWASELVFGLVKLRIRIGWLRRLILQMLLDIWLRFIL
jgi:hypothetical protein